MEYCFVLLTFECRQSADDLGFEFPEEPLKLTLFGPSKVVDYLTPTTTKFLAEPVLMDPLTDVGGLDDVQRSAIAANMAINEQRLQGYVGQAQATYNSLFYGVKDTVLKMDALNSFYMDLYGHVDGSLRELCRHRAVQVFKPEVRAPLLKRPEDPRGDLGLLGGDTAIIDNLHEANKKDEVISKAGIFPDYLLLKLNYV